MANGQFVASVHKDYLPFVSLTTDAELAQFVRAQISQACGEETPELSGMAKALFDAHNNPKYNINSKYGRRTGDYQGWRLSVFKRDHYTCQHCGQRGGIIHAHHVKRYRSAPSLRTELSNGVTLCERCHRELHRREGY